MAEIVCVIGNKGGTGKTTMSHMLCQGLGLLGQRAVCVLTDPCREPLDPCARLPRGSHHGHPQLRQRLQRRGRSSSLGPPARSCG